MPYLLQMDFPTHGPFGPAMTEAFAELAASINDEPGFCWKIWTENPNTAEAGGIYLFESHETAQRYLHKRTERLHGFGITGVTAKIFEINEALQDQPRSPPPDVGPVLPNPRDPKISGVIAHERVG